MKFTVCCIVWSHNLTDFLVGQFFPIDEPAACLRDQILADPEPAGSNAMPQEFGLTNLGH